MKFRTKVHYEHEEFWDSPFLFWFNRYRIDLFEVTVHKNGSEEEREVAWDWVTLKRNIDKKTRKMIRRRLRKSKNGYIGGKDIEVGL